MKIRSLFPCFVMSAGVLLLAVFLTGCNDSTAGLNPEPSEQGDRAHQKEHHDQGEHGHREHGEHGRSKDGEHTDEHGSEGRGEHAADGGGAGEGEEDGIELERNDVYDKVRNGVRLVLAFDQQSQSFKGTIENTTDKILERVRVEVHLSGGLEIGPTTPVDLKPGEKQPVTLTPETKDFCRWSTHAEVGDEEHAHGGEHDGERGEPGRGGALHR